jgi:uncharacterized protein YbcV (DUF1398 family)
MILLEYGAKNYFSFKEGFEISLRLNNNCPQSISRGNEFSNVLCVKGGNASGKTNVLKTLNFISEFTTDSFSNKPEDEIMIESHFRNGNNSEFFIDFEIKKIEYRYELELNKQEVVSEILYRKNKRYNKMFERQNDSIIYTNKEYVEIKSIKLRKNASIISTAHQYEVAILNDIYSSFKKTLSNVSNFGLNRYNPNISNISKYYKTDNELFQFVINQIRQCDVGITNIEILDRDTENGDKEYFPIFYHDLEDSEESA